MKIFLSAAETSSDQHAAFLMDALVLESQRRGLPPPEFFGLGGPAMQARGFRVLLDTKNFLVMGFVEILSRLFKIWSALRFLDRQIKKEKPDLGIVVDYPDFHFRLTRRLRMPLVYFIPPKVWAWRKSRVYTLKNRFKKVISILPFEVAFLKSHHVPVEYVGNPLLDQLPLKTTRTEVRKKLEISEDDLILCVMPGSRPGEIRYHWDPVLKAAQNICSKENRRTWVLIPVPLTAQLEKMQARLEEFCAENRFDIQRFRILPGRAHEALIAADVGLIKSGTSTLEAALLGCPHVVFYKANFLSEWIFKLFVRYNGPVSLTNLVYAMVAPQERLVQELLGDDATAQTLENEGTRLLKDSVYRKKMQDGFAKIRSQLSPPGEVSPSHRAACVILDLLQTGSAK